MNIMKSFTDIGGQLVSVTVVPQYPPIPDRSCDYCAYYTDDRKDQPNCGWGATREGAINDLIANYDYEDTLPAFGELYETDLYYSKAHWKQIEKSYIEFGKRFGIPSFDDSVPF